MARTDSPTGGERTGFGPARLMQRSGAGRSLRLFGHHTGITGRALVTAVPYLWLLLFFLVPFIIVLKISLSEFRLGMPPYEPIMTYVAGKALEFKLNLANYAFLFEDPLYRNAYLNSLKTSAVATLLCLLIGYPMAYGIARSSPVWRNILLLLVMLPFWTSFLLRVYAWIGILQSNGVLNNLLLATGLIDEPLVILQTDAAVYIGIVYSYLPFMVLPLYANLEKLDETLLEAAADLGCRPARAFFTITLPLSRAGIIAGSLLVFIPAVGEFVIPALLGGPDSLMIGRVLWEEFFNNRDWPVAGAVAIAMLLLLVVPITFFQRHQGVQGERR